MCVCMWQCGVSVGVYVFVTVWSSSVCVTVCGFCVCVCVFRLVEELWGGAVRASLCVSVSEVSLCNGAVHQEDDVS